MARPTINKRICELPRGNVFKSNNLESTLVVKMTIEEFEVFRLIDYAKHNQNEAASIMGVARTTVTKLYTDARSKIATYLVSGKKLEIEGGNYVLCKNMDTCVCSKRESCVKYKMQHKLISSKNVE